jgi:spermidine synthase
MPGCLCLILSGLAGLIYQIAWARQLAIVFGTSEIAVAAVLAAFMGGLAAGAWIVERILPRITQPIRFYAMLELGIAVSVLTIVPGSFAMLERLLVAMVGNQALPPSAGSVGSTLFYVFGAFLSLMIPTILMGATLPLMVRYTVTSSFQIGRRVGLLYAFNTVGAVAGSLVCAFMLLPRFGLSGTILFSACLNALAFAVAMWIVLAPGDRISPAPETRTHDGEGKILAAKWILPMMLLSGSISFLHEVLWTRLLGHILGNSIHAFAIMLSSFLTGIACGGAVGGFLARKRTNAAFWFAISQYAIAAFAMAAWFALEGWAPYLESLSPKVLFSFLLLLPLACTIGVSYPLAVRILTPDAGSAAEASARVYRWNTAGAVAGALTAAFLIIPGLRFEGAMKVAVTASLALAVWAYFVLKQPKGRSIALTTAIIGMVLFNPGAPQKLLRFSPIDGLNSGNLLFYDVGSSSSVVVLEKGEGLQLRSNGLPEASIGLPGEVPRLNGETWMAPLTVLARPGTRNILIVGYGSGRTISETPDLVTSIDVIELEPEIIAANRALRSRRSIDPLGDKRVSIIQNDVRGALLLTSKRYDAVISQPSHPWTAGSSHLHTREYALQVRDHLNPGGIFVLWSNIQYLDSELLKSLVATLLDVFSEVRLYRPDPDTLLFFSSDQPIKPESALHELRPNSIPSNLRRIGIGSTESLVTALTLDTASAKAFAQGAKTITDNHNRLATSIVHDLGRGLTPEKTSRLLAPYDVLRQPNNYIRKELPGIAFNYIGKYLESFVRLDPSVPERIHDLSEFFGSAEQKDYLKVLSASLSNEPEKMKSLLSQALGRHPDSSILRFEMLHPWFNHLAAGNAPQEITGMAAAFSGEPATVLRAARHALINEWGKVAELDRQLAGVPLTAPWSAEAVQLRLEWRIRVRNKELMKNYSKECIDIIDDYIVCAPNVPMLVLRAWSADRAGMHDAALCSIAELSHRIADGNIDIKTEERKRVKTNIQTLFKLLDGLSSRDQADPVRIDMARNLLERAFGSL